MKEHLQELVGLVTKAGEEGRALTTEELARTADLADTITKALPIPGTADKRRAFLSSVMTETADRGLMVKKGESFADRYRSLYGAPADSERLSMARLLRGYVLGDWRGAELERKAMASTPSTSGGVLIPVPLVAEVIDRARQAGVIFKAGATTVPMVSSTLTMPRIEDDPDIGWYEELEPIVESQPVIGSLILTAKKAAALVRVSNELLEDSPAAEEALMATLSGAMAAELDKQALVGPVSVPQKNPIGLLYMTGLNEIAAVGTPTDYSKWVDAYYAVVAAGLEPNAVVHGLIAAQVLGKLSTGITGDKTPLPAPPEYADLAKYVAAVLATEGVSFVGDWSKLIVGVRVEVMIEASRYGEGFSSDATLLRLRWRGDIGVTHPRGFTRLIGITSGGAA